jgi:predicted DNA-binding antitoxin AbrB/MazE fold protein
MSQHITAIVEQGRLRPTVPLNLPEGAQVELVIMPAAPSPPGEGWRDPERVRATIAELAALPAEPGPEFSGRDHDRILYGEGGAR